MKTKLITIINKVRVWLKKFWLWISSGVFVGVLLIIVILALSGCAGQNVVVQPQKQLVPVKIKIDPLKYQQAMQPPKILFDNNVTEDKLLDYSTDLQNKYMLLRNLFYNTIEGSK